MEVLEAVQRFSDYVLVDNLIVVGAVSAALLGVATIIGKIFAPFKRRIDEFLDWHESFRPQWEGKSPEHPGDVYVPGVMARLSRIDGEFDRNGGGSMKDAMVRLSAEVLEIARALEDLKGDVLNLAESLQMVHEDEREK